MPRPRPAVPTYRLFKPRNLAMTVVNGRKIYLGAYGSAESREAYARFVRESLAAPTAAPQVASVTGPKVDPTEITVAAVFAAFWEHAKRRYHYDPQFEGRRPPGELGLYYDAMKPVLKLMPRLPSR